LTERASYTKVYNHNLGWWYHIP